LPVSHNPHELPPNLPVPLDDGACDHLHKLQVPHVELNSTGGRAVDLGKQAHDPTVFFFYPRTGVPGQAPSLGFNGEEWDSIPGARGCTPQSCGFRDWHADFTKLGVAVFGVSTNTTEHQREFVSRNHVPFELLSDSELTLTRLLTLPTFEFPVESGAPTTLLHRMAWYCDGGVIEKVFYPVFPPDKNALQVLSWVARRRQAERGPAFEVRVRPLEARDLTWVRDELRRFWGGTRVASLGVWHQADELPGFVAEVGVERLGLLTHTPLERGGANEIITLSTRLEGVGVGHALMRAHEQAARYAGCTRLFLTTSNDNMRAMTFYQKLGWRLVAVHAGAIDEARRVTPGIPTMGQRGIPLRDEVELHKPLEATT
jgi:peroxiredoxin